MPTSVAAAPSNETELPAITQNITPVYPQVSEISQNNFSSEDLLAESGMTSYTAAGGIQLNPQPAMPAAPAAGPSFAQTFIVPIPVDQLRLVNLDLEKGSAS